MIDVHAEFQQTRTLGGIFRTGWRLYFRHWLFLVLPMVFNWFRVWLGLPCIILLCIYLPNQLGHRIGWGAAWVGAYIVGLLLSCGIVFWGLWRYALSTATLLLVVRDCLASPHLLADAFSRGALRLKSRAVDFALLILYGFALCFIPLILSENLLVWLPGNDRSAMSAYSAANIAIWAVLSLICLGLLFLAILAVPVLLFTPAPAGACVFRSAALVKQAYAKTLLIAFGLVPAVVLGVPTGLVFWLQTYMGPLIEWARQLDSATSPLIGVTVVTVILPLLLVTLLSSLLLPLGQAWLALLYADLKVRADASLTVNG